MAPVVNPGAAAESKISSLPDAGKANSLSTQVMKVCDRSAVIINHFSCRSTCKEDANKERPYQLVCQRLSFCLSITPRSVFFFYCSTISGLAEAPPTLSADLMAASVRLPQDE